MRKEFDQLLRFASISADPSHRGELVRCAEWVANFLEEGGLEVELWETSGAPTIYAHTCHLDPKKPTLLLYGHYDVQPVDPIELWDSPPFEPVERDGEIYARGAQDNKGQLFYTMVAVKRFLQKEASPPINIKFCIEGEEESGSRGLAGILPQKHRELQADSILVVDLGIPERTVPAITLGVRGLLAIHLECTGSNRDLHSGSHGGLAYNPNRALVELLAELRDRDGRIQVPGFYDDVLPISDEDRKALDLSFDSKEYRREFGIEPTGGEPSFSPAESMMLRPTMEINGLSGGYAGAGFKTVIPAKATAKLSCRLVPNQDPKRLFKAISTFLHERCPKGIELSISFHSGSPALRCSPSAPIARVASEVYTDLFGTPCRQILAGGSIPIAEQLAVAAGGDLLFIGLGLDSDSIHGPNEHFGWDRMELGVELIEAILRKVGEL